MRRAILRILMISGVSVVLIVFAGGFYLTQSLPSLPEAPEAPVLALPAEYSRAAVHRRPPYHGPHPRNMVRPEETFSFPIALGKVGPAEPLFAGKNQYPFLCGADESRNSQPLVDNHEGIGVPIFAVEGNQKNTDKIIGYSKDCSYPTQAGYYYNREGTKAFYPLEEARDDIAKIVVDGRTIDFVVRLETGTINRFIYAIAVLRGEGESLESPRGTYWNQRLIYQFRGGVGIGKRQGKFKPGDVLRRRFEQIKQGYAVVYSTANQTSNHYNIWLAEDTALRLKQQFTGLYGIPLYTVGIGGSGGAIQQYLLAQNNPDVLDAAIPLYSYPDMVSQTIYVMDCEPLEYFFDVVDGHNELWQIWENRSWIEGVSANSEVSNEYQTVNTMASLLQGNMSAIGMDREGATECVKGWRGLTPLVHNPKFVHFMSSFSPQVAEAVHWTHWDDLKQFYGVDEYGFANSTWDNVGVQYGLEALRGGQISAEAFLRLNAQVGGWKPAHQMKKEQLWILAGNLLPVNLSFWSHQNMQLSRDGGETPAARTGGSLEAINGAYRSGHVFIGHAGIPIIDVRHYLDEELDMHHATASFSARIRMLRGQGSAENQVIWMSARPYDPQAEALAVMDRWMLNILINPNRSVAENRPIQASDKCFDAKGNIIAAGSRVWDGDWNNRPAGACMAVYPRNKTSREIAGGGVAGDIFKCRLQSVSEALNSGVYGEVDMAAHRQRLEAIFPRGVCDFTLGDAGRPDDLLKSPPRLVADEKEPAFERGNRNGAATPKEPSAATPITLSKLQTDEEAKVR